MQCWMLLQQIFVQLVQSLKNPVFWLIAALLLLQIGELIWRKQNLIWDKKQVRFWLPAFLFSVLKAWYDTLLTGLLGGFLASVLFTITGSFVDQTIVPYMWVVMLVLFIMKRRFVCLAYAGGVLVLLQFVLLQTWPYVSLSEYAMLEFDGGMLLSLVAILLLVEAVLVWFHSTQLSVPVYLREKTGKTTIGAQIQMIWPIPVVMPMPILHTAITTQLQNSVVQMPEWWPVFQTGFNLESSALFYQLLPMLAFIGYSDKIRYDLVQRRIHTVSLGLVGYSLTLFILILYSRQYAILELIAGLFSIVGHEAIIHMEDDVMRKFVHNKKE